MNLPSAKKFKKSGAAIALLFLTFSLFAASSSSTQTKWTLAAMKFDFVQNGTFTSSQQGAASLIPQLILEQISQSSVRLPPREEMYDRKAEELLSARLALFLSLSAEIKKRDSLVLSVSDPAKLAKAIKEEEDKISDIQKQIDENLAMTAKAQSELNSEEEQNVMQSGFKPLDFFNKVFNVESEDDSVVARPQSETVAIYKSDSSSLFSVSDSLKNYIKSYGYDNREFEKAVTSASINGLITGEIRVYGDYAAVTATLRTYPGNREAGTVTEVGSLSDCVAIARNITRYLLPKIANNKSIDLYIDITPKEARNNSQLIYDGLVMDGIPEHMEIQSGIHTLEFISEGYNSSSVTYNFADVPTFLIHVPFSTSIKGNVNLEINKPSKENSEGSFFANGAKLSDVSFDTPDAIISVNGKPVIGQFVSTKKRIKTVTKEITDSDGNKKTVEETVDDGYLSDFFYIPSSVQYDGAKLAVNAEPKDNAQIIDSRRKWMYAAYSTLVVSLPFTFVAEGKYEGENYAYQLSYVTDPTALNAWNVTRIVAGSVSIGAGCFFIYELVRYLMSANAVIPSKAFVVSDETFEKNKNELQENYPKIQNDENADEGTPAESNDEADSGTEVTSDDIESVDSEEVEYKN